ncbi:MAG: phosphoribosylanthranilate isomerase [Terriglobales bacterium]
MTWVKICGITNLEDALVAVEAGADALGFVFYEKSPRHVKIDQVQKISSLVPGHIEKVGVFVAASQKEIESTADQAELTGWQLHKDLTGTPLQREIEKGGFFTIPNFKPDGRKAYISLPADLIFDDHGYRGFGWSKGADLNIAALFVDSGRGDLPGGTGKMFDWHQLQGAILGLTMNFNVVVAGGLTPDNVAEAMSILHPWGVDVSSGVEASPGKKDPDKVRAFIKAVRDADKANSN